MRDTVVFGYSYLCYLMSFILRDILLCIISRNILCYVSRISHISHISYICRRIAGYFNNSTYFTILYTLFHSTSLQMYLNSDLKPEGRAVAATAAPGRLQGYWQGSLSVPPAQPQPAVTTRVASIMIAQPECPCHGQWHALGQCNFQLNSVAGPGPGTQAFKQLECIPGNRDSVQVVQQ